MQRGSIAKKKNRKNQSKKRKKLPKRRFISFFTTNIPSKHNPYISVRVIKQHEEEEEEEEEEERERESTQKQKTKTNDKRMITNALQEIPACTLKAAQKRSVFVGLMMP